MSTSEQRICCSGCVAVPVCGILKMELPSMPPAGGGSYQGGYDVLTGSGTWTAPVSGWYRATVIGGGVIIEY